VVLILRAKYRMLVETVQNFGSAEENAESYARFFQTFFKRVLFSNSKLTPMCCGHCQAQAGKFPLWKTGWQLLIYQMVL